MRGNQQKFVELTDDELLNAIEDQKEDLFNLRFQRASGQLEDPTAHPRRAQTTLRGCRRSCVSGNLAAARGPGGGQQCLTIVGGWLAASSATRWIRRWWSRSNGPSRHRVYKKVIKLTKKVMAHDESNADPSGCAGADRREQPHQQEQALGGRRRCWKHRAQEVDSRALKHRAAEAE